MGFENTSLSMIRLMDGEFRIIEYRNCCGGVTILPDSIGRVIIFGKFMSYEVAVKEWKRLYSNINVAFRGVESPAPPSKEDLEKNCSVYRNSIIEVTITDRYCRCVDTRDISKEIWQVTENGNVLEEKVLYVEAVNFAHSHKAWHEGDECVVHVPQFFKQFLDYPNHDCIDDEMLVLKANRGYLSDYPNHE